MKNIVSPTPGSHLQPLAATCSHFSSHRQPLAPTCGQSSGRQWPPAFSSHRQPLAATCGQSSGCQWPPVAARASGRKWPQVAAFAKIKFVPFCTLSEILGFLSKQTFLHWFGNFHFVQARQVYYQLWCFRVGQ